MDNRQQGDVINTMEKHAEYRKLKEKPSSLLVIQSDDTFIVGTYELLELSKAKTKFPDLSQEDLEAKLKAINQRLGSLHLFKNTFSVLGYREISSHSCSSGGVFDMILTGAKCDMPHAHEFLVAHSNGSIGQYQLQIDQIIPTMNPIQVTDKNSTLLTSIDSYKTPLLNLVVVGDSEGYISMSMWETTEERLGGKPELPYEQQMVRIRVCLCPVWRVHLMPSLRNYSRMDQLESKDQYILVGADDSSWYIYKYDYQRRELLQIYKNTDFNAGITSFCFRVQQSHNMRLMNTIPLRVFVGSYDETIREYSIEMLDCDQFSIKCLALQQLRSAGIWRMQYLCHQGWPPGNDTLVVTTMYEQPCKILIPNIGLDKAQTGCLSIATIDQGQQEQIRFKLESLRSQQPEKPLYYGCLYTHYSKNYCLIDFNNRLVIFVYDDGPNYSAEGMRHASRCLSKAQCYSIDRWLGGEKSDDKTK